MRMNDDTGNNHATRASFWQLIQEKTIRIPNYQREYAQGRDNPRAKLIRTGFVNSLYDSIKTEEPIELDFIFGGKESDNTDKNKQDNFFSPVDGQQRLTILFLLHWYVFMRADQPDKLKILGDHFQYKTRTTSETFCKKICKEKWAFDYSRVKNDKNDKNDKIRNPISSQIQDKPWFTGAMDSDPTVKSMLVVIDCIHERFSDTRDLDYKEVANKLTSADRCPISFFHLDLNTALGITSGIRDLYIKMNARGLPLTDYELFKASLQKKEDRDYHFDLMAAYLADKDELLERTKIIGKFNNEYTNFFFNLIDNNQIVDLLDKNNKTHQMFDISLLNFPMILVRSSNSSLSAK